MNSVWKWTAVLLGTAVILSSLVDRLYGYRYEDLFRVQEPDSVEWKEIPATIDLEFQLDDPDHV